MNHSAHHHHHNMTEDSFGSHMNHAANGTSMAGHGHGGGHSMHGGGGGCKMMMYWNWYTKGACFLTKSWKIGSATHFGLTCIFIIFLVVAIEFVRRMQREYDRYITRDREEAMGPRVGHAHAVPGTAVVADNTTPATTIVDEHTDCATDKSANAHSCCGDTTGVHRVRGLRNNVKLAVQTPTLRFRPTLLQQFVRALLYTVQFGVGYLLMLFVMYYNGYIYFCMLIGAFIGFLLFSWDNLAVGGKQEATCC